MAAKKESPSRPTANRAASGDYDTSLDIQEVRIADLKPAPYNPRKIGAEALSGLSESMKRFGVKQPIIWNKRTGNVIAGHQRLRILRTALTAEDKLPVVVVDVDDETERLMNVELNNPRIAGSFDVVKMEELSVQVSTDLATLEALHLDKLFHKRSDDDEKELTRQLQGFVYRVIIECDSEEQQREMIDKLEGQGITCRALIS
jgi:hypothetical protein